MSSSVIDQLVEKNLNRDMPMFGKIKKLYFVGIGGAGMSGIAEILMNLGYAIKGSDITTSEVTEYLQAQGITIYPEHSGANLKDVDVVVISSAVGEDNPEVIEARRQGIPVIKRAEMLGELMRLKYSIGVSGTHGKNNYYIDDRTDITPWRLSTNINRWWYCCRVVELGAELGAGRYLVAEADEYDKSFLAMYPSMAVVTNLEADHLDCYNGMEDLLDSFVTYMNRVPFYGSVILSADDENLSKIKHRITRPHFTFGFSPDADYRAMNVTLEENRSNFSVYRKSDLLGEITINAPGQCQCRKRSCFCCGLL